MILYIFLVALVLGQYLILLRLGNIEQAIRDQTLDDEPDFYEDESGSGLIDEARDRLEAPSLPILGTGEETEEDEEWRKMIV